jgi:amidophosphoribosyltransferase
MPAAHELVAHGRTEDEVCAVIGADKLIYQNLSDLIAAVQKGNPNITQFDTSCFDEQYITGDIDQAYLERVASLRNDKAKAERKARQLVLAS